MQRTCRELFEGFILRRNGLISMDSSLRRGRSMNTDLDARMRQTIVCLMRASRSVFIDRPLRRELSIEINPFLRKMKPSNSSLQVLCMALLRNDFALF